MTPNRKKAEEEVARELEWLTVEALRYRLNEPYDVEDNILALAVDLMEYKLAVEEARKEIRAYTKEENFATKILDRLLTGYQEKGKEQWKR